MANLTGFSTFTFDEGDDKVGVKSNRFKAKDGETYRASFMWFPGTEEKTPDYTKNPRYIGCKRGYRDGVGYFLASSPELEKLSQNPPKPVVGTVLVLWPTDRRGEVDKDRFSKGDFDVKSFVFSEDKYQDLKTKNSEFPFGTFDVKITCTDAQYQKLSFSSCNNSLKELIKEKRPEVYATLLDEVRSAIEALPGEMAQNLTIQQLRDKIAKKGGGTGGSVEKATSKTPGVSASVDDLLGDVLEG